MTLSELLICGHHRRCTLREKTARAHYLFGHAAQHDVAHHTAAVRAHDDQIDVVILGEPDDLPRRRPTAHGKIRMEFVLTSFKSNGEAHECSWLARTHRDRWWSEG